MTHCRRFLILIIILFSNVVLATQMAKPPEIAQVPPAGTGIFHRKADGGWIKLERASMVDSKAHGLERFLDTDGYSGLNVTLAYRGSQAPLQLSNRKPGFYVRGIGAPKETLIVQLSRKKESRETTISSTEAAFDNKVGFKKGEIRRVIATPVSKTEFTVVPEEELKPGEYLLIVGEASTVYDFGIAPAGK